MCFTLKHDQLILPGNALFRQTDCGQHHNTHTLTAVKEAARPRIIQSGWKDYVFGDAL